MQNKEKIPVPESGTPSLNPEEYRIEIDEKGPYRLYGQVPVRTYSILSDAEGCSVGYDIGGMDYSNSGGVTPLCRCGRSGSAPICDGSHVGAADSGEWDYRLVVETGVVFLDRAERIDGGSLVLTDVEELCAFARFCDAKGRTWNQVERSSDLSQRQLAIETSEACPAGRLKVWDRESGEVFEPEYSPAVGLIEDTKLEVSGPLFVMGGIPLVTSEGKYYQPRNRVTLCRCGESRNKPFCDGTHAPAHYIDGV